MFRARSSACAAGKVAARFFYSMTYRLKPSPLQSGRRDEAGAGYDATGAVDFVFVFYRVEPREHPDCPRIGVGPQRYAADDRAVTGRGGHTPTRTGPVGGRGMRRGLRHRRPQGTAGSGAKRWPAGSAAAVEGSTGSGNLGNRKATDFQHDSTGWRGGHPTSRVAPTPPAPPSSAAA